MKCPARCQSIIGILLCFLMLSAPAAFAQALNLALIRRTSPVSPLDRQNIGKWVSEQLDTLINSPTPHAESPKFQSTLLEHVRAADATPAFKETLAQSVSDALMQQYPGRTSLDGTNGPRPLAVIPVLVLLDEYKEVSALNAFKVALADSTSPGVRYAAAKGLFGLRAKLTGQQWTALLPEIKKAATAENDPPTLKQIYRLLSVDPKAEAQAQEVLPLFLDVLNARLTRYEQQNLPPCVAEAVATNWLREKALATPNMPRRNDVILSMARLLAETVLTYTDPGLTAPQKKPLEELILTSEDQLKQLAKAGGRAQPDVSKVLAEGGAQDGKKLVDELNKWIGNGDAKTDGFLNQAPFNFPLALGIRRAAPATATAPAG